jgi:iron-sulfur cluster assembly protein
MIFYAMLQVTDNAVEQLRVLLSERVDANAKGLRVAVAKGGCSGMQYEMTLDNERAGDSIVAQRGVRFFVDQESAGYLHHAILDYHDGLTGTGFTIKNPNAARTCGCGSSFEPAKPA